MQQGKIFLLVHLSISMIAFLKSTAKINLKKIKILKVEHLQLQVLTDQKVVKDQKVQKKRKDKNDK